MPSRRPGALAVGEAALAGDLTWLPDPSGEAALAADLITLLQNCNKKKKMLN